MGYVGPGSCSEDSYEAAKAKAVAVNGKELPVIPVKGKIYVFSWCSG